MIDPTKTQVLGSPDAPAASPAAPAPTIGGPSTLPAFTPQAAEEAPQEDMQTTLGRLLWGRSSEGGINPLADVPIIGDLGRFTGEVQANLFWKPQGWGIGAVTGVASDVVGAVPQDVGDPLASKINAYDPVTYPATPAGGMKLIQDLNTENHAQREGGAGLASSFLVLGQWQRVNDPEAFKAWNETLAEAQKSGAGKAAEMMSRYLREWGVTYADLTPDGVGGALEVAPELAFASPGSLGQSIGDALSWLTVPQRHAERGAAAMSGSTSGLGFIFGTEGNRGARPEGDFGSRVNELLDLAENKPGELNPIEAQAVYGMKELGWTARHAYNFLLAHGQGFSSEGASQLAVSFALDPLMVAGTGAAQTSLVGARWALKSGVAAERATSMYAKVAERIGTTVATVRSGPTGPAWKVARTIIDPFSAFEGASGPRVAAAKKDVLSAVGITATERGLGIAPVQSSMRRADRWGVRDIWDRAFGTASMNLARKYTAVEHVANMLRSGEAEARMIIDNDLIETVARNQPADAVTRMSDYVQRKRAFWLSEGAQADLAERMAKMTGLSYDEMSTAVRTMDPDEQAVWHLLSYNEAYRDFDLAKGAVPLDEWGDLQKSLDEMVILNPAELDEVAAQGLLKQIGGMKGQDAIDAWNAAGARYNQIGEMGRVETGAQTVLKRNLDRLERMIQQQRFHAALDPSEMGKLPESFRRDFLDQWTGANGQPIWRIGFRPKALDASGLVYENGDLVARFEPNIPNVTEGIVRPKPFTPVTDALKRAIPDVVSNSRAARGTQQIFDALGVAVRTSTDMVTGQRIMTSMEQSFVRQMRAAGYSDRLARDVFKLSREASQDGGFTLAGMSPKDFWKANQAVLGDVVSAEVGKREIFEMLAKAAGGDLRTLGLTSGFTQRVRSGLIAAGVDPNNYLGAVSVKTYNAMRYILNPTFFLQTVADAPFFNTYRGVPVDLLGTRPPAGSAAWEMQGVAEALGHSSLLRDLQMDMTERVATIGFQRALVEELGRTGMKRPFLQRVTDRIGQMILNNELHYINSRAGDIVYDAINTTKKELLRRADEAATAEEAALWRKQAVGVEGALDHIVENMTETLGRAPTPNEVGARYLSEMVTDSHTARLVNGMPDYKDVMRRGDYFMDTGVGQLQPLHLDYGAASLGWPGIHNKADLRTALLTGKRTVSEVKETMLRMGFNKTNVDRFVSGITFNWRHFFDGMATELNMTAFEMRGLEDMVAREAKMLAIQPEEYLSQVVSLTAQRAKKVSKLTTPRKGYASTGRLVPAEELAAIRQRGKDIVSGATGRTLDRKADILGNAKAATDDVYTRTMKGKWGGTTFSPRLNRHMGVEPWMYHGTMPSNLPGIGEVGMRHGSNWIEDLEKAKGYAMGKNAPIFRAKPLDIGGTELAPGWRQGGRVKPNRMQVSTDGGATWKDVVEGSTPGGPWSSAIGKSKVMPAKGMTKAKFNKAYNEFVAENEEVLRRQGNYVGTFKDEAKGTVEFDVVSVQFTEQEAEAVQTAYSRTGGAYNFETGNGLFAARAMPADLDLTDNMKLMLDIFRAAEKGSAGIDEMTQLVASRLHPSMKQTLLTHFEERITGPNGLIEQAMAAGDTKTAQDLNLVVEDLRGGWGKAADDEFRDLVIRRAGGEKIMEPEVERAARYFSAYLQAIGPQFTGGDLLRNVVERIPVRGGTPHNFTQSLLKNVMSENFRIAEKDAIRLAHMQTERTVLERSLNHPFFGIYPSSYFWGKVIPETFKFIAYNPFGIKTTLGLEAYFKVQTSVALQAQYDEEMAAFWEGLGESATVTALSYLSPAMPWEDMESTLPPWAKVAAEQGLNLENMTAEQMSMMSPERWARHGFRVAEELSDIPGNLLAPEAEEGLSGLMLQQGGQGLTEGTSLRPQGPVKATGLGPILQDELVSLEDILRK